MCLVGTCYFYQQIKLGQCFEREGITITGIVLDIRTGQNNIREMYYVLYEFQVNGVRITNEMQISPEVRMKLTRGGFISVCYLPGNPRQNIPVGYDFTIYWYYLNFCFLVGAGCVIGIMGIIRKFIRGGYDGGKNLSDARRKESDMPHKG